ncbi:MAG: C39 family peptidase [Eubacterium sp.]|nr:C39 family peptidase [Eubacterium sp.]
MEQKRNLKKNTKRNIERKRKQLKLKKMYFYRMILLMASVFTVMIIGVVASFSKEKEMALEAAMASETNAVKMDYEEAVRGMTLYDRDEHNISKERADELLKDYASQFGISESAYTKEVRELLMNHYEARDFVFNYPVNFGKATASDADADSYYDIDYRSGVPHLYQWDTRWGFMKYGSDALGITGCGPTSLSMVAIYLLKDTKYTPDYIAQFSVDEGFAIEGNGTSWALMSEGAQKLGLLSVDVALDENRMAEQLLAGRPLICILGPGRFTDNGHFIVITGYEDYEMVDGIYTNGKFVINDPNCVKNSERKWSLSEFQNDIGAVWAYTLP